ncbi:3-oxoacyl-ACP synthase III family protein [Ketobacter sp.]|uniref:3-oxoacyl-ACP synthase III family protein n=1 Tax=Ketobacter sp. TaxID=2083498 RepID=UPI000F23C73F|nr:ketoacyl-ACP synthase III [Ketobacter sp.]RLU00325.1 MAG: ketoacyl-ACP synthase III [Ketobacter sp.]
MEICISSTGLYLPPRIQSSAELSGLIGRSEEWIVSRTGVRERRVAEEGMEFLAAKAALAAIGDGPRPDCIINASLTPVQLIPDSAVFVQKALGWEGVPCWSVHATCLSFVVALLNASGLIQAGIYRSVLVVSAEAGTPWRNLEQPESAALFGDGAAAALLEQSKGESAVKDWIMYTWPEGSEFTEFRGCGTRRPPGHPDTRHDDNLFNMQGPKVFRMVLMHISRVLRTLFERNDMTFDDIDLFILHQASGPGMEAFVKLGFPREKIVNIVADYGNCVAASIPMTLAIANEQGRLRRGDRVLIGGTGAGLSIAFALLQW